MGVVWRSRSGGGGARTAEAAHVASDRLAAPDCGLRTAFNMGARVAAA
jgi:hypothetical protein